MKKTYMKSTFFFTLLVIAGFCRAQDIDLASNRFQHKNQLWTKFKLILPVNSKLELSTQYIGRISVDDHYQQGNYFYLSGKYKIKKWIQTDLGTRFVIDNGHNLYRLEGGIRLKQEVGRFQLSFRTAAFRENKTYLFTDELAKAPSNYWRNRLELAWAPTKKITLSNSFETWNLHNNRYAFKLNKACYIAELNYDINKRNRVLIAYQNQFDIHKKDRVSLNMYCVGYVHTFRKVRK